MEITKEYLLNKIRTNYYDIKLVCEVKPDVIYFKIINIKVAHKQIIYFHIAEGVPKTTQFDLTEEEYENIIKNNYEWKKIN